jgi:hypothetical protein
MSNANLRKSFLLFCLEKAGEVRVNDGRLFKYAAFPPALHAAVHNFSHRGLCSLRLPANSPKIKKTRLEKRKENREKGKVVDQSLLPVANERVPQGDDSSLPLSAG